MWLCAIIMAQAANGRTVTNNNKAVADARSNVPPVEHAGGVVSIKRLVT